MRKILRKLQIADFDQNWDFLPFFRIWTVLSTVFRQVLRAQITSTDVLNLCMYLDIEDDQRFRDILLKS